MRRFAWDGLSFDLPADWDLAFQETRLGITRIRIEDSVAVRLTAEWLTPSGRVDLARIMARFEAASKSLRQAAKDSRPVLRLPADWSALLFRFEDGRRLVMAFHLSPEKDCFGFFQFHFDPGPASDSEAILHRFIASFQRHTAGPVPWACYDIAFLAPAGFTLESAAFHPGLKRFTFSRSLRHLHAWHVSFADLVIKREGGAVNWAIKLLTTNPLVRGLVFAEREGAVVAERPGFLGRWHFMEVLRGCFRYQVGVRHDVAANRLVLACYQYRFPSDLIWLTGTDLPFPPAPAA